MATHYPRARSRSSERKRSARGAKGPVKVPINVESDSGIVRNAVLDCGWGRLLFGQTFAEAEVLAKALAAEGPERRDIAIYVQDPHVVLAASPQMLFLDPSHTFRLDLQAFENVEAPREDITIRPISSAADAEAINRLYAAHNMVRVPDDFFWSNRANPAISVLVAEDAKTGVVVGTVMGIDHRHAFGDVENGSSLWCLAVDPQATQPGIGESLVRALAKRLKARGAAYMDLSVLYDNSQAIALYEKLGFFRVPYLSVKRKNPINEKLFVSSLPEEGLNPYARIIVDEARRRGIDVEVTDAEGGFFRLTYGGRSILCRESLSELTTGVAVAICDDKAVTRRVVEREGIRVPAQIEAGDRTKLEAFLAEHGAVVVKPARGEQGKGVAVGLTSLKDIDAAVAAARSFSARVLIEQCVDGEDLRLVVIGHKLVAAAIRRAARVVGDGKSTIRKLIERQSRRRGAATGGESRIPIDAETKRCLTESGYQLDDIPNSGTEIRVRRTANLHTGGTLHDVTDIVHPTLVEAAIVASQAIGIPVVGIDLMVKSPQTPDYYFIEANERPGLANHEPQPTAERFVDLLFPLSVPASVRVARTQD
jgi:GNAT-family acetyltransferase (TIGR03103 family)